MSETQQAEYPVRPSDPRHDRFFETESVKANLRTTSIRGGAYMMSSAGASLVLTIASTAVLARLLLPADFGLLGMVFALTAIAERFKDIGLGRSTIQKKELTHSEVSNLFWLNAGVGVAICIAICLLARAIAGFYHEERLTRIAMALSTTFVFGGLTIQHQALLNRRMRFFASAAIATVSLLASSALAIVLAMKGFGYWSLVWREIARSVITAIGTFIACPWVPGLPVREQKISHHVQFGRDITVFNLVTYFSGSVDQILLGKFAGAAALGTFRQAFQLVMMPSNQITAPVHSISEPLFSALQDDGPKYVRGFRKAVSTLSLITMPMGVGLFVCAGPIVSLLLGPRWLDAVILVKILAIAAFLRPAISAIGFAMISCGKTGRYAALGILDSLALVLALSVGVMWGAPGIAIAHVVATYFVFLPFVWWALKDTPVSLRDWLQSVARPAIGSVAMGFALFFFPGLSLVKNNAAALGLYAVAGAACYFAIMLTLPGGRTALTELVRDIQSAMSRATRPAVA